uniref:Uncharacterized protein n=1 Tax=Tanacetum cinerariifolium TaxID=118510 RepID=A0A6L2NR00_TANCI|nr:hypothetical protein [Tanacetum cinerariifolium]
MPSRESPIRGANVNSSTVLLSTGSLLAMSILSVESLLSLNSRLSSGNYKHLDGITVRRDDDKLYNVKSYQKKLNLTRPDTYRSDLKRKEAYSAYSNLRGFIYQNKDKQNRLMRIDELHKFNDGMLTDVRTALEDRFKGIRMKYLPKSIWRKSDKDRTEWEVKFVESLARTKLVLGFKEYIRSDEVCDLSTPSVFVSEPDNKEVKSLYASDKSSASETYDFASCVSSPTTNDSFSTVDVKILPKSDVKDPSPTNGFSSCSFKENVKSTRNLCNKSGIAYTIHCKNNFVRSKKCFVYGGKSYLIKDCHVYDTIDNFPSVALKATSVPAGSRNSSASTSADRSILAASRNRSASIHAGRFILAASRNRPASIHAGTHISAGRSNKPAPFPAGQTVPTGWTNHAARPFFGPTNLYFDNVVLGEITDLTCNGVPRTMVDLTIYMVYPHVNKDIGIVDSGCSRSMIGNKEKLADFVQNKVLFTDDECLVLTKEFQLPDESQVVL